MLGYCGDPDVEGGTAAFDQKGGEFKNVRNSTLDAETGALAQCTMRVIAARQYMADLHFPQREPIQIGEDNNAALLFSKSPLIGQKARHIHVDYHLTREQQQEFKTISVIRKPSSEVSSDMLTKNLGRVLHQRHSKTAMGNWEIA